MTEIRPVADSNKVLFYPQTHADAVIGFEKAAQTYIKNNPATVVQAIQEQIQYWHDGLTSSTIKLQSPGGTAFLLSISDDGKLTIVKEGDTDAGTISDGSTVK